MYRLNPVGALILECLAKGSEESEIARQIAHKYNIPDDTAITDVHEFLESLKDYELVCAGGVRFPVFR